MSFCTDEMQRFRRLGVNVIVPDYLGYGMSGGRASEAGCYAAADAAYDYLLTRPDVDRHKLIASGWSLGGAVAIDLAHRRPISRLITISTFTTLRNMAPECPISIGLLRYQFDNLAKLPEIYCPTLIIHGSIDTLVPASMAPRLVRAPPRGWWIRLARPHRRPQRHLHRRSAASLVHRR